jgi:hypothetical protein
VYAFFFNWLRTPQQTLRTHRSLVAYCAMMKMMIIFCPFPSNGAPVEWNWQGKTEELGEKPVPVPLCPPQMPHGLTQDRTRASAVGGRRLTAWAMARPVCVLKLFISQHVLMLHISSYTRLSNHFDFTCLLGNYQEYNAPLCSCANGLSPTAVLIIMFCVPQYLPFVLKRSRWFISCTCSENSNWRSDCV